MSSFTHSRSLAAGGGKAAAGLPCKQMQGPQCQGQAKGAVAPHRHRDTSMYKRPRAGRRGCMHNTLHPAASLLVPPPSALFPCMYGHVCWRGGPRLTPVPDTRHACITLSLPPPEQYCLVAPLNAKSTTGRPPLKTAPVVAPPPPLRLCTQTRWLRTTAEHCTVPCRPQPRHSLSPSQTDTHAHTRLAPPRRWQVSRQPTRRH